MNNWRHVRFTLDAAQAMPDWVPQNFLISVGDLQLVSPGRQSVGGKAKQLPVLPF